MIGLMVSSHKTCRVECMHPAIYMGVGIYKAMCITEKRTILLALHTPIPSQHPSRAAMEPEAANKGSTSLIMAGLTTQAVEVP